MNGWTVAGITAATIAGVWIAGTIATTALFTHLMKHAPVDGTWWTGTDDDELNQLLTEGHA